MAYCLKGNRYGIYPIDMIDVGLINERWLPTLPQSLRSRLQELLDNPDQ